MARAATPGASENTINVMKLVDRMTFEPDEGDARKLRETIKGRGGSKRQKPGSGRSKGREKKRTGRRAARDDRENDPRLRSSRARAPTQSSPRPPSSPRPSRERNPRGRDSHICRFGCSAGISVISFIYAFYGFSILPVSSDKTLHI